METTTVAKTNEIPNGPMKMNVLHSIADLQAWAKSKGAKTLYVYKWERNLRETWTGWVPLAEVKEMEAK